MEGSGAFIDGVDDQHARTDDGRARISAPHGIGEQHRAKTFALPGLRNGQASDQGGADQRLARHLFSGSGWNVTWRQSHGAKRVVSEHDVRFGRLDQDEHTIRLAPDILARLRSQIAVEAVDAA